MFNPLLPDLSTLKSEDVDNKITELMKKYSLAARFGQGMVCQQISVILEAYKDEQKKRHHAATQKLINQNKNLDDFINVDH
jgi:hypothetical protein